jgi:DNA-binding IclR family transcriptional regulator
MLCALTDQDVEDLYPEGLLPITEQTCTSMPELLEELRVSRERGYTLEEQESTPGIRCIGVLVPVEGRVLAMSMAIPISRATNEDLIAAAPRLIEAAATVGERLAVRDWFSGVGPIEVDG